MFRSATPEKAIAFAHLTVALTYCWPLPSKASNFQIVRFKIARSIKHVARSCYLNTFALIFPLLYAVHVHRDDAENVAKAVCQTVAITQTILQTAFFITQYEHLQRLIGEMILCCEKAKSYERQVFQRYVSKYSTFYGLSAAWFYLTAISMIVGTLVLSNPFPINAEYPFLVNFQPVKSIIFVHQAFAGLQCAAHVCVGIFCALLLLFAAARFEILMIELRTVTDIAALIQCVRKYYTLRRYAQEVIDPFRYIILLAVVLCAVAAVFCGISILEHRSVAMSIQLLLVAGTAFVEVFMYAWPADHLIDASENAMQGGYESECYDQPLTMQKSILLVLTPQPPVVVGFRCIIPVFSLDYYCSFISTVFSMFTALRVVIENGEAQAETAYAKNI